MKVWDIARTLYKVSDFISWQKSQNLVLSPSFQRRSVWKPEAKSYLMDTIIRGLPIPIIFLREKQTDLDSLEPTREVVDGQQRIRTVISFVAPYLLKDLKEDRDIFQIKSVHNKDAAGKDFKDLSKDFQRGILDYQFAVHVLPPGTDDRDILQIFSRMNSTGMKLNPQELRNAEFFGEFKTSVYQMALEQLNKWREWGIFTEDNISRMNEVELTSEFAIMMLKGITGKSQAAITRIYKEKDSVFIERSEIERRFRIIMELIQDIYGKKLSNMIFRKKTLFYCLFAYIYDMSFGLNTPLRRKELAKPLSISWIKRINVVGNHIINANAPKGVLEAAERRTTHLISRREIVKYLKGEI